MFDQLFKAVMGGLPDAPGGGKFPPIQIKIPKAHPKAEKFMQVVGVLASKDVGDGGVEVVIPTQFQPDEAEAIFLEVLADVIGKERVDRIVLEVARRNQHHAAARLLTRDNALQGALLNPAVLAGILSGGF